MAVWGITSTGFYRPTLDEITIYLQETMRDIMGSSWDISDSSRSGMLIKAEAGLQNKVWQQAEATYYSQTKNGAEGNFLDERYSYFGVLRKGASAGSGEALIETDKSASDISEIISTSLFAGDNGIQYKADTTVFIKNQVQAYKISGTTLSAGTYSYKITNRTGSVFTAVYSLLSNSDVDRLLFFNNLSTFFKSIFTEEQDRILIDSTSGNTGLYIGFSLFNNVYSVIGMSDTVDFEFTTSYRIGNRFTSVSCTAIEVGYNPLSIGGITGVLPTPYGFVSATNIQPFSSGAEIQSDAEYSTLGEVRSDAPKSSTRSAIYAKMLDVEGVTAFALEKVVSVGGIVSNTPLVLGGTTPDIAQALYESQAADNVYSGATSYTVGTEDGRTEVIKFTRAIELKRSVRIKYTPINGITLSSTEITNIKNAIENVNGNLGIGSTEFNGQLAGAVFDTNPSRFVSMSVETKNESDPDTSYTSTDFTPSMEQLPLFSAERVEVIRI